MTVRTQIIIVGLFFVFWLAGCTMGQTFFAKSPAPAATAMIDPCATLTTDGQSSSPLAGMIPLTATTPMQGAAPLTTTDDLTGTPAATATLPISLTPPVTATIIITIAPPLTATITVTAQPPITPTRALTATVQPTATLAPTATMTGTVTSIPPTSATPPLPPTSVATGTTAPPPTQVVTPVPPATVTPSPTASATLTPSPTVTPSRTMTPSPTLTPSATATSVGGTPTDTPTPAPVGEVYVRSHRGFARDGSYHVVGEVVNALSGPIFRVTVVGTFFNANGQLVATQEGYGFLAQTSPDQRNPFRIQVPNPGHDISRYELAVSYEEISIVTYQDIAVLSQEVRENAGQEIAGEVQNDFDENLGSVVVAVALYDESGAVVDVYQGTPNATQLAPGEVSAYVVPVSPDQPFAGFGVQAQGKRAIFF
jgi:hypothetical protein